VELVKALKSCFVNVLKTLRRYAEMAVNLDVGLDLGGIVDNLFGPGPVSAGDAQQEVINKIPARNMADITSRVDAAKAAGLHPLAAMGVNIANASPVISERSSPLGSSRASASYSPIDKNIGELQSAQMAEMLANAKRANAEADSIAQDTESRALARLASQPGNPPGIKMQPRQVTMPKPTAPTETYGTSPSEDYYLVKDAWGGADRRVKMPGKDYGQAIEQLGEVWQFLLGTPFAADILMNKYLQTPYDEAKVLADKSFSDAARRRRMFTDFPWTRLNGAERR
jgi:hypothetical protein